MTTTADLEAELRQLFREHEHLADVDAPARLASDAVSHRQSSRRGRVIFGLAATALLVAGTFLATHSPGLTKDQPTRPAAAEVGQLKEALGNFEASWAKAQPPRITMLGSPMPQVRGSGKDGNGLLFSAPFEAAPGGLSQARPGPDTVRWDTGASAVVPVMSAAETFASLQTASRELGGPCDSCWPHRITGATQTTMRDITPQGEAQIPAWEFTLENSSATVVVWAVPSTHLVVAEETSSSMSTPNFTNAVVSDDNMELTLEFVGESPECPVQYSGTTARSDHAVAVLLNTQGAPCAGMTAQDRRHITVRLDEPLGAESVLDARVGNPIRVQG